MTRPTRDEACSRALRQLRILGVAAAAAGSLGIVLLLVAFVQHGLIGPVWGICGLVIGCAVGIAWTKQRSRVQALVLDRFFEWIRPRPQESRTKPTKGVASLIEDVSADWIERLAMRGARLRRMVELNAPEPLLVEERRLVREAMAKVDPAVAFSILRAVGATRDEIEDYD